MASIVSPPVNVTDTTPQRLLGIPPKAKLRLVRLLATNLDGTNAHRVELGTVRVNPDGTLDAASFVPVLAPIVVAAGSTVNQELPRAEALPVDPTTGTEEVRVLAARLEAAAGAPVVVQVEAELG